MLLVHASACAIFVSPPSLFVMKYNSKLRNSLYEQAIDLYYREGLSEDDVADKLDIGHTTVNRWTKEYAMQQHTDRRSLRIKMGCLKPEKTVIQEIDRALLLQQINPLLKRARKQLVQLEQLVQMLTGEGTIAEKAVQNPNFDL